MQSGVTRTSGEIGDVGEFVVEDYEADMRWQGSLVRTKSGKLSPASHFTNLEQDVEPGWGLQGDLCEAIREFVKHEVCTNCKKATGISDPDNVPRGEGDDEILCQPCYDAMYTADGARRA